MSSSNLINLMTLIYNLPLNFDVAIYNWLKILPLTLAYQFRDGHGPGLGQVYPNPTREFYLCILNPNTRLAPVPICYSDFFTH